MTMFLVSTFLFVNFFAEFITAESTAVVSTTNGPVQGEILTTVNSVKYASFKGIRYGKPPIGWLRFKPPIAADPWTDIYNATTEGPDCIQYNTKKSSVVGSEDCLFLNVQTPVTNLTTTPTLSKSVMVWIFGGGYVAGTSSSTLYKPDYLLEKDVVYVSFNYRLGALGFLGIGHPNATGNAALKDQVLALKWVQANIAKFGGNPKNVTIFGESAGAASVGFHVLSKASAGLFQAVIAMSGVPLNPLAFHVDAVAQNQAVQLAALLGTVSSDRETLLKTFYVASAAEIVKATTKILLANPPFAPTIEDNNIATDVFMTECSLATYLSGEYNKVPVMMGYLDQETSVFLGLLDDFMMLMNLTLDSAKRFAVEMPPTMALVKNTINTSTNVLHNLTDDTLQTIVDETTSLLFISQIDQTQKLYIATNDGKPVYYYHISFYEKSSDLISQAPRFRGAGHGDDLGYIFYFPSANFSKDPLDPARRAINGMTTIWTNFAKYGNPTPSWVQNDLGVSWPESGKAGISLNIGFDLEVTLRPMNANTIRIESSTWPVLAEYNGCGPLSNADSMKLDNIITNFTL